LHTVENGQVTGAARATDEQQLLIEAVTVLTQRQIETQASIGQHIGEMTQRIGAIERRFDEFEVRLVRIDEQVTRLAMDLEKPAHSGSEQRVTQLRAQIERLNRGAPADAPGKAPPPITPMPVTLAPADTLPIAPGTLAPTPRSAHFAQGPTSPTTAPPAPPFDSIPKSAHAESVVAAPPATPAAGGSEAVDRAPQAPKHGTSLLTTAAGSRQDWAGVILIGLGLVAVLYAVLTQIRI
jgi:hypothetical protein